MMFEEFWGVTVRSLRISVESSASRHGLSCCLTSFGRHGAIVTVRSLMMLEEY